MNDVNARAVNDELQFIGFLKRLIFALKWKIMGKNTPVALGVHFEDFAKSQIEEGRFKNISEVIRAGLRLLEHEEQKYISLQNVIKEGIESGVDSSFDPKLHLKSLKESRLKRG